MGVIICEPKCHPSWHTNYTKNRLSVLGAGSPLFFEGPDARAARVFSELRTGRHHHQRADQYNLFAPAICSVATAAARKSAARSRA
jgi:hypothetical protein